MGFDAWLAFCATEVVLCFIPGPAVLFVVSVALARGTAPGLSAALGILAGNVMYFALSATGVAAVIIASHQLFSVLQWAGAAYLVWLGLRLLLAARGDAAAPAPQVIHRPFLRGFLVQAANPKALVFFVALLPQFIDAHAPVGGQILILGASSVLIELAVLALYVSVAGRARRLAGDRVSIALHRFGGAGLILAGARLALTRNH